METKKQETGVAIPQKAQALTAFPEIQSIAEAFVASGMFPTIVKQAQAVVKIIAGQELGFPAVFSMMNIDVVLGKLRLNSQAIATLVKRSGRYDYQVKSHTNIECVLVFTDGGKDVYESSFSIADAQRAGLVKPNSGWVMYPQAMLFARAVSQGAKIVCPHLMAGAEPLEDSGYEEVNGEIAKEGEPPPSAWRSFWAEATDMGFTEEEVHVVLGVASVKVWLAQGRSLEEAIRKLSDSNVLKAQMDIAAQQVTETASSAFLLTAKQESKINELALAKGVRTQEELNQIKWDAIGRVAPLKELTAEEGDKLIAFLERMQEAK